MGVKSIETKSDDTVKAKIPTAKASAGSKAKSKVKSEGSAKSVTKARAAATTSEDKVTKKPQTKKSAAEKAEPIKKAKKSEAEAKKSETVKAGISEKNSAQKKSKPAAADKAKKTADKPKEVKSETSVGKTKKTAENADVGTNKKSAPKADTAENAAKRQRKTKAQPKQDNPEISSKTPQVMKLMEQKTDVVNPTILAGKSSIPRRLRGIEPLSRIMRREAEDLLDTGELETYNITALVIDEHAAEILRRFNACDCELCVEHLSRLTAEEVPARFVKLKKSSVERNSTEVEQLKEPLRSKVTQQMIRLVITNKKRSYHDLYK